MSYPFIPFNGYALDDVLLEDGQDDEDGYEGDGCSCHGEMPVGGVSVVKGEMPTGRMSELKIRSKKKFWQCSWRRCVCQEEILDMNLSIVLKDIPNSVLIVLG